VATHFLLHPLIVHILFFNKCVACDERPLQCCVDVGDIESKVDQRDAIDPDLACSIRGARTKGSHGLQPSAKARAVRWQKEPTTGRTTVSFIPFVHAPHHCLKTCGRNVRNVTGKHLRSSLRFSLPLSQLHGA
jgi:hypothetical protein